VTPTGQSTTCSKMPRVRRSTPHSLHFPSPFLCARRAEPRSPPLPRAPPSPRALVTAPPPPKSCPSLRHTALHLLDQPGASIETEVSRIATSARSKCHRNSAVFRVTVASTAPESSVFPRSRSLLPITHRCSGEDATAIIGLVGPEHDCALPRHGCRPGAHAVKRLRSIPV
jgi:hypothetical protein